MNIKFRLIIICFNGTHLPSDNNPMNMIASVALDVERSIAMELITEPV